MAPDASEASVIVCTRNRPHELERCLLALGALARRPREIIVVNSAGDDTARQIAFRQGSRYLETNVPGVSHARNLGIAAAQSEWIAFLDDDSIPESNWLNALLAPFEREAVAAVFGEVASQGEMGSTEQRYNEIAFQRPRLRFLNNATSGWFWAANTGQISIGANMAFRRSAVNKLKGFDTRLGRGSIIPGAEEHRICSDLIEAGYACALSPGAIVRHPSLSDKKQLRDFETQMIEIAAGYLTLTFLEQPAQRMELLSRAGSRFFRRPSRNAVSSSPSLTVKMKAAAVARGLRLCWRATRSPKT